MRWIFAALALAVASPAAAQMDSVAVLEFTVPRYGQLWTLDPDTGDSVATCQPSTTQVRVVGAWVYWSPAEGGGYRRHHQRGLLGREGLPDTVQIRRGSGGHAYLRYFNDAGEGCSTNEVWVPGPAVTSVSVEPSGPQVVRTRLFDVRGRLVERAPVFAILLGREYLSNGQWRNIGRVLVLHGGRFVRLEAGRPAPAKVQRAWDEGRIRP